jgi:palmitoyltransferase
MILGFLHYQVHELECSVITDLEIFQLPDGNYILERSFPRTDGQWIAIVVVTGLLGALFAGGMFLTTLYNAAVNRSTNEQIVKRSYNIAVRLPRRVIERNTPLLGNISTVRYPLDGSATQDQRVYAVIQSKPADNIWSVSYLQNLKSVLGDSYIDWILPLHYPPCTRHDNSMSDYPLGRDFERLCREAGIR